MRAAKKDMNRYGRTVQGYARKLPFVVTAGCSKLQKMGQGNPRHVNFLDPFFVCPVGAVVVQFMLRGQRCLRTHPCVRVTALVACMTYGRFPKGSSKKAVKHQAIMSRFLINMRPTMQPRERVIVGLVGMIYLLVVLRVRGVFQLSRDSPDSSFCARGA